MCKKHKKLTLILGLFIFGSLFSVCSWLQEDKKWRNHLKEEVINGVKNPYMVDEMIYKYIGQDDAVITRGSDNMDRCSFVIYTLKDKIKSQKELLQYLKSFDDKELQQGNSTFTEGQVTNTTWLPSSELSSDYFSSFTKINEQDNYFYQRFLECKNFLSETENYKNDSFVNRYKLDFYEKFRNDKSNIYTKNDFVKVINDDNTFVQLRYSCRTYRVYFLNMNKLLFIRLTFDLAFENNGKSQYSLNQNCK